MNVSVGEGGMRAAQAELMHPSDVIVLDPGKIGEKTRRNGLPALASFIQRVCGILHDLDAYLSHP